MDIFEESKKHLEMICPMCEKVLKATQLTIHNDEEATLLFICGCSFRYYKSVKLKVAVDQIG